MPVSYLCDSVGHIAQLPALIRRYNDAHGGDVIELTTLAAHMDSIDPALCDTVRGELRAMAAPGAFLLTGILTARMPLKLENERAAGEALVGFLDTCERTGDEKYFDAFWKTWRFDRAYFIEPRSGEWRQLLTQDGVPIAADLGNPWKAIYHTGRAMLECRRRLTRILRK